MKLIIVESPTKAKTISKFLGKDFNVQSSYGHVRDLPKSKLGIDIDNNYEPGYIIPVKAKKLVTALKKEAKKSDEVILATDEDREGEAIAWHLIKALGIEDESKTKRIVFHEITERAIKEALKNPRELNINLVNAQQGRRVLDRIVGYKLSPFLWKKVASKLSAGRVQSVALRLVVDRENDIRKFKPEEYWSITANLMQQKSDTLIETSLSKIDGKSLDKFSISSQKDAEKLVNELKTTECSVETIERRETKKNPLPPFITSTLQQEGVKRLYFSTKKTMMFAQRLYEKGFITYMRTDSLNLSTEATVAAKEWLSSTLGEEYAKDAPRVFKAKSKLAQEAHEAIRPTDPTKTPEAIKADGDMLKVYTLIWQRFMASQMPQARIAGTTIEFSAKKEKTYTLKATGQEIVFDGYLKIWPQKFEAKELPQLKKGEMMEIKEVTPLQHFTEPLPRYSEATLIKTLEEYGIGRPSTYSPTISVIQTRNYVIKESGKFHPTDIGELVNKVLTENFPDIVDINFTAKLEDELDEVALGKLNWQSVINDFYGPFAKDLEEKYETVKQEKPEPEMTDEKCDKCDKPMVIKMSRFGKFLGCSGFPECKRTKNLAGADSKKAAQETVGMKCPNCEKGDVVVKRVNKGRARGRSFWGCSRYPDCEYATWEDPTDPNKKTKEE